jgi:LysR family transcriptional regulator, benzoate and cis,cis-muconate-responsive activator of ben and cat genes
VLLTAQVRQFQDKARSWLEGLSLAISNINNYPTDKVTIDNFRVLGYLRKI